MTEFTNFMFNLCLQIHLAMSLSHRYNVGYINYPIFSPFIIFSFMLPLNLFLRTHLLPLYLCGFIFHNVLSDIMVL